MTRETKKIVEKLVFFTLFTVISYCYLRYFMLPETGMLVRKASGVWLESTTIFPYSGELDFKEWPTVIQQRFMAIELGIVIALVIIAPIIDLIFEFLFGDFED